MSRHSELLYSCNLALGEKVKSAICGETHNKEFYNIRDGGLGGGGGGHVPL